MSKFDGDEFINYDKLGDNLRIVRDKYVHTKICSRNSSEYN